MIKVRIDGINATIAKLSGQQKQVAFAASRALNTLAFQAMREGRSHIQANLDKPTAYTVTSWRVRRKATKANLEAVVGWGDYLVSKRLQGGQDAGAEYYLAQHWSGGGRKLKAFERHMRRTGILPEGMYTVPGKAAEELGMIDGHGNFRGSAIVAIMSKVGALDELGYSANATVRQSKRIGARKSATRHVYWVGKPGKNTPMGIWMIDDKFSARGRLRPVMIFVRQPMYRVRLHIEQIHRAVLGAGWAREFDKELSAALRTAR